MAYSGYRDLKVYQQAYQLAVEIFDKTKRFPTEEKYSLTDQIRRSSRSVPANIAEAWKKRKYPKSFVAKMIDAAGEAGEVEVWLDFSRDHGYFSEAEFQYFSKKYSEVSAMLYGVVDKADKFCDTE